jgi:tetratricopeptide (TPR) repeat protein
LLSGAAQQAKLKEASEYRDKANKCLQTGLFKSADPLAASTYFKRAADCYHQLGDLSLERLFRLESAKCNQQCQIWASAASDYTKAAELTMQLLENPDDESTLQQHRRDASQHHQAAAQCYLQLGDPAKAAAAQVAAALVLLTDETKHIPTDALRAMEEAIEAHVPDPLNPYARYRSTGVSSFRDPDDDVDQPWSADTVALAQQHLVNRAYAHEPVQQLVHVLTQHGEYAAALYAAGAVTVLLQQDNMHSTLSLSRAFCVETVLTLALGDPVTAEQAFLNRHVQKTFYLTSRECQLSEELIRAIKNRSLDQLDEARDVSGVNRTALANLPHDSLRRVVQELRVSGVARAATTTATTTTANDDKPLHEVLNQKTGYEPDVEAGAELDGEALANELGGLNFEGLDDSANDIGSDGGVGDDELDELEDDDIDLR